MKKFLLAIIASGIAMSGFTQTDSTNIGQADTIKVGGMIIIRKSGNNDSNRHRDITVSNKRKHTQSNVTTNWWVVDLGFANYSDNTNYASAAVQQLAPGSNEDWFKLRTGKSVNVNIWAFMQRLNMVKHYVNLVYGLGVELNNYRFDDENILFQKNPTHIVYNSGADQKMIGKNKLAADYVTVPVMLNINFTPNRKKGFGISGGVSAGYLYSARQKLKYDNDKKEKLHSDFDLNKWKLSYIGEVSLGPVRLYGSYAFKSMWTNSLDQTPYTVGIRFSNW